MSEPYKPIFDAVRAMVKPHTSENLFNNPGNVSLLNRAISEVAACAAGVTPPALPALLTLEDMIEATIGHEGHYVDHPDDRGGETCWGITKWVARKNGYLGPMRSLPREEAVRIYRDEYAIKPGFDVVAEVFPRVAAELFDTGVNMGPRWPALWLQMSLNAFNRQAADYPDIKEDMEIGPATMAALRAYKAKRGASGEEVLLKALNSLQGGRYIELTRGRPRNESFAFGWFKRVAL